MPEPIFMTIATALVTKAVGGLYDVVKAKLGGHKSDAAALEAAVAGGPESDEVARLAEVLERAERADPVFAARLHKEWAEVAVRQRAHDGGVTNQITGHVNGNVVQARDIHGGVTF
jgi:hypothetical protein